MKNILTLLMMIIPIWGFSQSDSGFVQFYIYPDDCDIKLNNSIKINAKSKIKLPVGETSILIKRNMLETVSDKIIVQKDTTIQFRKILKTNESYKKYQKANNWYLFEKTAGLSVGILGSAFIYYLSYKTFKTNSDKRDQALADGKNYYELYNKSYTTQERYNNKINIDLAEDRYISYGRKRYYAIPIAVVGMGFSYYTYKYISKLKKPKYIDQLSVNYNYSIDKLNCITLNYKF